MIEAKSLRIGNKFSGAGMIQTVKAIETYNPDQKGYEYLILVEENRNQYKPVDMEPIPITPDILDQLDLVKDPSIGEWFFAKFNIRKENEDEFCIYMQGGVKFWFVRSVKHLHELQNAIHALTGKEIDYQQK